MKLHSNSDLFGEALQATALHFSISEIFIEKDYWVTYVLKAIHDSDYFENIVFKGGTSLSKAYKLVKRFSEDIDLALLQQDELSSNQIKGLITKIEKNIIKSPLTRDENHPLTSKGSKYRKTAYNYPKLSEGADFGHARDAIILEINAFTIPTPFEVLPICSLVGEFVSSKDKNLMDEYDLHPFELRILSAKRTFVEKILSLVRAGYESNENLDSLKEKIRHIYDITMLLKNSEIKKFVESKDFTSMIKIVQIDDAKHGQFSGEWSQRSLAGSPLFKNPDATLKQLKGIYSDFMDQFVYEDVVEQSECKKAIESITEHLR